MDQCCSISPTGIWFLHSGHISSSAEVLVGTQAFEVGTTAACRWYHLSIVEDAADPARPVEAFLFRPLTLDATLEVADSTLFRESPSAAEVSSSIKTFSFNPRSLGGVDKRTVLLELLVSSESESESTITASCSAG